MPYALRDAEGQIISLHREPVAGAQSLDKDHPEVVAFLGRDPDEHRFADLDANLVRVLEDLIDALIRRNLLNITDLPVEAQGKLFDRKHFREGMKTHALSLFEGMSAQLDTAHVVQTDWSDAAAADLRQPPQAD